MFQVQGHRAIQLNIPFQWVLLTHNNKLANENEWKTGYLWRICKLISTMSSTFSSKISWLIFKLKKFLYRLQVWISMLQELYIALCSYHPKSNHLNDNKFNISYLRHKNSFGVWGLSFYAKKSFFDHQILCLEIKFNYKLINTYQNGQKVMERT